MTATPSALLQLQIIDVGTEEDTWGTITNPVLARLEQASHGEAAITIAGSNVTLDDTQYIGTESHKKVLKLTGAQTADVDIIVPARTHVYYVLNDTTDGGGGPWTTTVKVTGQTGVDLAHGDHAILYANGTDVEQVFSTASAQPLNANLTTLAGLDKTESNTIAAIGDTWTARTPAQLAAILKTEMLKLVYPVGSTYINQSDNTNPATLFGFGTWEATWEGRVPIGEGTNTDARSEELTFTVGDTDTSGEYKHVQGDDQVGNHPHILAVNASSGSQITGPTQRLTRIGSVGSDEKYRLTFNGTGPTGQNLGMSSYPADEDTGTPQTAPQPMNNMMPYVVVYAWLRTA